MKPKAAATGKGIITLCKIAMAKRYAMRICTSINPNTITPSLALLNNALMQAKTSTTYGEKSPYILLR